MKSSINLGFFYVYEIIIHLKVFNFYDEHNLITIITQNDINLNSLDGKNSKETEKLMLKKINKVSRDIEYDNITDNNYPTVIGSIGMTTDN